LIRKVAELLPAPEALLVAGAEERRAMLFALGRRADAESVALLRWAVTAASAELGLEAALALEDLSIAFEKRLEADRQKVTDRPTRLAALDVANCIRHGFEVGILDAPRIEAFAGEARRYYDMAAGFDPSLAAEVAIGRARLELAILKPDLALEVLDAALPTAPAMLREELHQLRAEAVVRSHDLPWEGTSLLATYRRTIPPRSSRGRARVRPPTRKRQIG
jgi:hypothetical protein